MTDSAGKKILWEKDRIRRSYQTDTSAGYASMVFSICATDDGGFTIVGDMVLPDNSGGYNAIIAHFIPKPVSAVVPRNISALKSIHDIYVHVSGKRLIVSGGASMENIGEVSLFDITGRRIATQTGNKEIVFDISKLSHGTYFVQVTTGSAEQTMKIFRYR